MSKFPESEKLAAVSENSQAIGEFLDWLKTTHDVELPCAIPALLEQYFEIDMGKVEKERQLMLRQIRRANIMREDVG